MYSRLRLFELKKQNKLKTKHNFFFIELSKLLEVLNFTFLGNFRFLTLVCEINHWMHPFENS